jgi:hypothetical protein
MLNPCGGLRIKSVMYLESKVEPRAKDNASKSTPRALLVYSSYPK